MKANLLAGSRREKLEDREHLVVPVIMMRSDVVMNEILVPANEILPFSWDGVPVTLQHPEAEGGFTSANSPDIIEKYSIGTIFNSKWDTGVLKAEAWIDIEKANALKPGLVKGLEDGEPMDVSTGFFSDDIEQSGESNGRIFKAIARNLNPDHLALLPGGTGACSWEDGCGVRANQRKDPTMATEDEEKVSVSTLAKLLETFGFKTDVKTNRRGDDDDYRQVVADLISNDASPFVPNDEDSLRMMSYETLLTMRNSFLPGNDDEKEPKANKKEATVADDDKGKVVPVTMEQVTKAITDALAPVTEALKANTAAPALAAEDRAALDAAKNIVATARQVTVAKIVANTKMTEEQLKSFSDANLEVIAAGINEPVADYGGRGFSANFNEAKDDDEAVKDMETPHVNNYLKAFTTDGKAKN